MRRIMVLAMAMMLVGCATAQMRTASTYEMIDKEPIFQMLTEVCDPFGNECIVVQTFQRQADGTVGLIDSKAVGGPGIGYAVGVGVTAGTGAAATGGLLGVWAAHELRPDQTNVQQVGGGYNGNIGVVAASDSSSYAEGGDANANAVSQNYNVSQMEQSQGQQMQQQQQQRIQPAPTPVQVKPPCNKPKPVSSPQIQGQAQNLIVR